MNKLQKIAFINLCLAGLYLIFMLLFLFSDEKTIRIITSVTALIACVLLLVSYIYRMICAIRGGPHFDERDAKIHKKAGIIGLSTLFIVSVLLIFISALTEGSEASITLGNLIIAVPLVIMIWFITDSLVILIQYGWREKGKKL